MNDRLRAALARRIESHNRLVKLTSIWSGLLVTLMWVAIYFFAQWMIVLLSTIIRGADAEELRHFWVFFLPCGILWVMIAWIERARNTAGRSSERTLAGAFIDLFLAPPRATLTVISNFRARISFTETELDRATVFLERMGRAGKIPVTAIEVELPDSDTREHILESLQFIDLVCARRSRGVEHLYPANPQSLVRFIS